MCGQSRETTDVCVDQCYIRCSFLLWRKKKSSIVKLIVIKWMPDLIEKIVLKRLGTNIIIWNLFVFETKLFILCVIYQNFTDIDPGWRQTEISCIGLFDTNLGHWTHDTQIHRATECPAKLSIFYFAQQIIYKSIDFVFLCMLVVYEWVCKYVSEINEWNCTYVL